MQDQNQCKNAKRLSEQVVRERKPSRTLASDEHPDQQEDRQGWNAEAAGPLDAESMDIRTTTSSRGSLANDSVNIVRTELLTAATQPTVYVIATNFTGTRAALETAVPLARGSRARLEVLVPQLVPYPLPIDEPPNRRRLSRNGIARSSTTCARRRRWCLRCRRTDDVILQRLPPAATVVLGGAAGVWRASRDERLARRLTRFAIA